MLPPVAVSEISLTSASVCDRTKRAVMAPPAVTVIGPLAALTSIRVMTTDSLTVTAPEPLVIAVSSSTVVTRLIGPDAVAVRTSAVIRLAISMIAPAAARVTSPWTPAEIWPTSISPMTAVRFISLSSESPCDTTEAAVMVPLAMTTTAPSKAVTSSRMISSCSLRVISPAALTSATNTSTRVASVMPNSTVTSSRSAEIKEPARETTSLATKMTSRAWIRPVMPTLPSLTEKIPSARVISLTMRSSASVTATSPACAVTSSREAMVVFMTIPSVSFTIRAPS